MRIILILLLLMAFSAIAKDDFKMPPMHHLFEVQPSKKISIPDSFPLNKNKQIDCQTCHGIKEMKKQDFKKLDKNSDDFFREGPYEKLSDFCYQCHNPKPYRRNNIHKMLDDKGKPIKKNCLYCHEEVLDPEDDFKTDELKLRLPAKNICYGCHLYTPHMNALGHQKKPHKMMKKRIRKYEKENQIVFPLANDGKIMCVTCHSSHQLNVISQKKAAGKQVDNDDLDKGISYQKHAWNKVFINDKKERLEKFNKNIKAKYVLTYQRIENEILLRLPAKNGRLCMVCHDFEVKTSDIDSEITE